MVTQTLHFLELLAPPVIAGAITGMLLIITIALGIGIVMGIIYVANYIYISIKNA